MRASLHRIINTLASIAAIGCAVYFGGNQAIDVYNEVEMKSEMSQLISDEGFRRCVYKDSLGYPTIGFGHLIKNDEVAEGCIDYLDGLHMFKDDYREAKRLVEAQYSWANGEVELVLTNMMYQLGPNRLAKFKKFLHALKQERYDIAAAEMLDSKWAKQTPNRARRLAFRVYSLSI